MDCRPLVGLLLPRPHTSQVVVAGCPVQQRLPFRSLSTLKDARFVCSRQRALQRPVTGFCRDVSLFPETPAPDSEPATVSTASGHLVVRFKLGSKTLCRCRTLQLHMSRRRALRLSLTGTCWALPPLPLQSQRRRAVSAALAAAGQGQALMTCTNKVRARPIHFWLIRVCLLSWLSFW